MAIVTESGQVNRLKAGVLDTAVAAEVFRGTSVQPLAFDAVESRHLNLLILGLSSSPNLELEQAQRFLAQLNAEVPTVSLIFGASTPIEMVEILAERTDLVIVEDPKYEVVGSSLKRSNFVTREIGINPSFMKQEGFALKGASAIKASLSETSLLLTAGSEEGSPEWKKRPTIWGMIEDLASVGCEFTYSPAEDAAEPWLNSIFKTAVLCSDDVTTEYSAEVFNKCPLIRVNRKTEPSPLRLKWEQALVSFQRAEFLSEVLITDTINFALARLGRHDLPTATVGSRRQPQLSSDKYDELFASVSELLTAHGAPGGESPVLSIIIPVYNNGRFLLGKCLASILDSRALGSFELLLVDDGSTSAETLDLCKRLAEISPGVRLIAYCDGGSGSASRPRNRGIDEARGELLTFLDPDNEISPGGYDKLIDEYEWLNSVGICDFVAGYQQKIQDGVTVTGRLARNGDRTISHPVENFIRKGKYPVISTQASVIRTELLKNEGIRFVEGAVGQDSLFGWQVFAASRNPRFVDSVYITYYAERVDSVTNVLNANYFRRALIREQEQVKWLQEVSGFESFKNKHFPKFFENWYLDKFQRVAPQDRWSARVTLEKIARLYGLKDPVITQRVLETQGEVK